MARTKQYSESTIARFPSGTLARAKAVLAEGETQGELVRVAMERELRRRERACKSTVEEPSGAVCQRRKPTASGKQ